MPDGAGVRDEQVGHQEVRILTGAAAHVVGRAYRDVLPVLRADELVGVLDRDGLALEALHRLVAKHLIRLAADGHRAVRAWLYHGLARLLVSQLARRVQLLAGARDAHVL